MSEVTAKILEEIVRGSGPTPGCYIFGEGIDWLSPLATTELYVELPFWLMVPPGRVNVEWSGTTFPVVICAPWMEVFAGGITDSRITCVHQGPWRPDYRPPPEIMVVLSKSNAKLLPRPCKTVLSFSTRAHTDAFRERTEAEPMSARAEQQIYLASLCEAHLPVLNELIQRYRLVTYDNIAYEVSAWDVPIWYLKHADRLFRATLAPYKSWDFKPTTLEGTDTDHGRLGIAPFQWTTASDLGAASSADATPGEFDLLDARSLMERGDYTGAVRRTVTAIEAVLEWALLAELRKKYPAAEAEKRLQQTANNFPARLAHWRKLVNPPISQDEFDAFDRIRKTRHQIVHRGFRLTHADRASAEHAVETGRSLFDKIEAKPGRAMLRIARTDLSSISRVALAKRFSAVVGTDGITLEQFAFSVPSTEPDRMASVLFNSANAKSSRGDSAGAIADYTLAAEIWGISADLKASALFNRASAKGKLGDINGEVADYTAVVNIPGISVERKARSIVNRGVRRGEAGDHAGAIDDFSTVLETSDASLDQKRKALFNRAFQKGKRSDVDGAIADFTGFLELPDVPAFRKAYALHIRAQLKDKKGDGAIADFTSVVGIPEIPTEALADALICRGDALEKCGNIDGALADFTTVVGMAGLPPEKRAGVLQRCAAARLIRGDTSGAIADCNTIVDTPEFPDELKAWAILTRLSEISHDAQVEVEEAIADLSAVAEMEGASAEQRATAICRRGDAKCQKGDIEGAIADYATTVNLAETPTDVRVHALLARASCRGERGDFGGAISDCTDVASDPSVTAGDLAFGMVHRGYAKAQRGDAAGAILDFSTVVDMPDVAVSQKATALFNRAVTKGEHGDLAGEIADYTLLIEMQDVPHEEKAGCFVNRASANREG